MQRHLKRLDVYMQSENAGCECAEMMVFQLLGVSVELKISSHYYECVLPEAT